MRNRVTSPEDFQKPLEEEDLTFESEYRVDPNIFLNPRPNQTGELNYEPDLSRFLSDEFPGSKSMDSKPIPVESIDYELPNAINFNKEIAAEKPNFYTSPSVPVYPPAKTEAQKPVTPPQVAAAVTPIDQLRHENLANDPFLESAYGEEEQPKRKGIRRNVLLISGLFTLIVMLCLITVMVLSGYSLDRAIPTPTFSAALVGELNPATPKITLPPIESPTAIPSQVSTETPEPTGTPLPTGTPTETPLLSSTPTSTPTRMKHPRAPEPDRQLQQIDRVQPIRHPARLPPHRPARILQRLLPVQLIHRHRQRQIRTRHRRQVHQHYKHATTTHSDFLSNGHPHSANTYRHTSARLPPPKLR